MGIRCEVCDEFLNIFQLSKLCITCYKIRTIVKAYNSSVILKHLENNFLVKSDLMDIEEDVEEEDEIIDLRKIKNNVVKTLNKKVSFVNEKMNCDTNSKLSELNNDLMKSLKEKLKHHTNSMICNKID